MYQFTRISACVQAGLDVCIHLLWNLAVTQTAQSYPLIEYIVYVFDIVKCSFCKNRSLLDSSRVMIKTLLCFPLQAYK